MCIFWILEKAITDNIALSEFESHKKIEVVQENNSKHRKRYSRKLFTGNNTNSVL